MASNSDAKPLSIIRIALTIFLYGAASWFVALMLTPVLVSESAALRTAFNVAFIVGAGWLFFSLGAARGEKDSASDAARSKTGKPASFYRPGNIWLGALIAAAPWVIIGVVVALTAQPYTYTPQDLPSWLNAYMKLPEVGLPLAYYIDRQPAATALEWMRVALRFSIMPYVSLFAAGGDAASYMLDRLSFLPPLVLPALYAAGYLTGPRNHAKTVKYIEDIKAKPRMRLKKSAVQKRRQKAQDPERNRLV